MTREVIALDLTPDTSLFEDIGAGNLASHEAVAEIVANSFDARVLNDDQPLFVDITVDDDSVIIIDNAGGISRERVKQFLKISEKRDQRGEHEKGKYGWGLKASASTIGYLLEVVSRPIGEKCEIKVTLPIRELASGKLKWTDITADIDNQMSPASLLGKLEHGTAIKISDLRQKSLNKGDLERHLRFTYAPHLKDGDRIVLNGTPLEAWEPVVLSQMKHEFDTSFGDNDEYRIRGWIGIGKTQSSGEYGLNIYRLNQLIEAWNKDAFSSKHAMTSRVVGEVHADFVPTNFNKKGIEKESKEWKALIRFLREQITPFLAASRQLSRDKSTDMNVKMAQTSEALANQMSQVSGWKVSSAGNWVEKSPESAPTDVQTVDAAAKTQISTDNFPHFFELEDGRQIEVAIKIASLGDPNEHWSYVPSASQILTVLNEDSPLIKKFSKESLTVIEAFAVAESIQDYLVTRHNFGNREARRIRDEYLARALAGRG